MMPLYSSALVRNQDPFMNDDAIHLSNRVTTDRIAEKQETAAIDELSQEINEWLADVSTESEEQKLKEIVRVEPTIPAAKTEDTATIEELSQEINEWLADVSDVSDKQKPQEIVTAELLILAAEKQELLNIEEFGPEIDERLASASRDTLEQKPQVSRTVECSIAKCIWTETAHSIIQTFLKNCNEHYEQVIDLQNALKNELLANKQNIPQAKYGIIKHLNRCNFGCKEHYDEYILKVKNLSSSNIIKPSTNFIIKCKRTDHLKRFRWTRNRSRDICTAKSQCIYRGMVSHDAA